MPDGTPGSDGAPNATPATPTVPEGMTLVPKTELETLQRQANNYKGAAPLLNAAVELGLKTPDELRSAFTPVKQAREMGLDLSGVLTSIRKPESPPAQPTDAERLKSEILGEFRSEQAMERHAQAQAAEEDRVSGLVAKMVGEKGSDGERRAARGLVYDFLVEHGAVYESGPLKGRPRPANDREFSQVAKDATETWTSIRGQHLKEIAANAGTARSSGPPAPGGAGAGDGSQARKPGQPPTRDEVVLWLERQRALRAGAPLSQA